MSSTGYQKSEFCLKQGRKISDFCLKQGQGMRGRAAPPHPRIYRVSPPGVLVTKLSAIDAYQLQIATAFFLLTSVTQQYLFVYLFIYLLLSTAVLTLRYWSAVS